MKIPTVHAMAERFPVPVTVGASVWAFELLTREAEAARGRHDDCWDNHCIPGLGGRCPETNRIKRRFRGVDPHHRKGLAVPKM